MKYITLIISFALILTNCHKYPEGGWSNVAIKHLFGANKNNASKVWKLKLYEVNGIDSTVYITPNNGTTSFQNNLVTFKITTAKAHDYFLKTDVYSNGFYFSKDKKTIITGDYNGSQCKSGICERNIFQPEISIDTHTLNWKINKLQKHEFIITGNFKNSYKIIFIN